MAEGFNRYTGDGNDVEHEAGYDAYMTGVIYLAFIAFIREKDQETGNSHLKRKRSLSEADEESESEEESEDDEKDVKEEDNAKDEAKKDTADDESSEESGEASDDEDKPTSIFLDKSITPYYGRIFLMRSDIPYIDLKGEEQVGELILGVTQIIY